jgi:predicted GNAT family acetyltransferase
MENAHALDRPVWHALTTRQANLACGDGRALRFAPDYGLFAASADESPESLAALAAMVPADGQVVLVEAREVRLPPGTKMVTRAVGHQMIAQEVTPGGASFPIAPLTDEDAPEMLALATLTKPGPFFALTHRMGDFVGVKQDGRLVAMAGERMKPTGFTEVSGVCTHPDYRGHGYAGGLTRLVAARILARGETPFLHVYASNSAAIALYRSLGFALRRAINMTVLTRGLDST